MHIMIYNNYVPIKKHILQSQHDLLHFNMSFLFLFFFVEDYTEHLVRKKINETCNRALTALLCCYNTTGSKMLIFGTQSQ